MARFAQIKELRLKFKDDPNDFYKLSKSSIGSKESLPSRNAPTTFVASIYYGAYLVLNEFLVDVGGAFLWMNNLCRSHIPSSSFTVVITVKNLFPTTH